MLRAQNEKADTEIRNLTEEVTIVIQYEVIAILTYHV